MAQNHAFLIFNLIFSFLMHFGVTRIVDIDLRSWYLRKDQSLQE